MTSVIPGGEPSAPVDETTLEQKETAGLSQSQIVRKRFFRHKGAVISLVVLVVVLVVAITSIGWGFPGWWKWKYTGDVPDLEDESPTLKVWPFSSSFAFGDHPFGVDNASARDIFAAVMRGTQQTLVVILIMGLLSTIIGVVLGALAGYFRGWVDAVIMRFTDLVITLPTILIVAVVGRILQQRAVEAGEDAPQGVLPVAFALGILSWTGLARLVRAEFLTLREREFVDAARVAGASNARIIFKHILPNTVSVIVVNVTLLMGGGILAEAGLSYLQFGIQPPDISLGTLISEYSEAFQNRPWLFVWPGVIIIIIVLCINFIGDGLRDAYDPRQKRIPKAKDLAKSRQVAPASVGEPS